MNIPYLKMATILIILVVWYIYFSQFNYWDSPLDLFKTDKWMGFSNEKGDWGTFGDFVGGVLNPILTFITIVMLINSLKLQREANEQLIKDEKRQEKDVLLKRFEDSFFNLISSEREEFGAFSITVNSNQYNSSRAVTEIEQVVWDFIDTQIKTTGECDVIDVRRLIESMDNDSSMSMFSMVRCVYVVFKIVKEKCPEAHQDYYLGIFVNMMPVKLVNLVSLLSVYMDWKNISYINTNGKGFMDDDGVQKYIKGWKDLH
ncbi:hypothetical protein [Yersinia mollaretii]|uniref:hypothetical protein n=1 Tax=Yersinia mollaretii TaxID=33060 RepID=UPI0005DCB566|nr:hypothetical protein [Yersinia mollaretii]ELI7977957.1 hypothetical protein [Yersinia enterocolitica]CQD42258.1 Uncharacterised protein [Yersinia mollaretii]